MDLENTALILPPSFTEILQEGCSSHNVLLSRVTTLVEGLKPEYRLHYTTPINNMRSIYVTTLDGVRLITGPTIVSDLCKQRPLPRVLYDLMTEFTELSDEQQAAYIRTQTEYFAALPSQRFGDVLSGPIVLTVPTPTSITFFPWQLVEQQTEISLYTTARSFLPSLMLRSMDPYDDILYCVAVQFIADHDPPLLAFGTRYKGWETVRMLGRMWLPHECGDSVVAKLCMVHYFHAGILLKHGEWVEYYRYAVSRFTLTQVYIADTHDELYTSLSVQQRRALFLGNWSINLPVDVQTIPEYPIVCNITLTPTVRVQIRVGAESTTLVVSRTDSFVPKGISRPCARFPDPVQPEVVSVNQEPFGTSKHAYGAYCTSLAALPTDAHYIGINIPNNEVWWLVKVTKTDPCRDSYLEMECCGEVWANTVNTINGEHGSHFVYYKQQQPVIVPAFNVSFFGVYMLTVITANHNTYDYSNVSLLESCQMMLNVTDTVPPFIESCSRDFMVPMGTTSFHIRQLIESQLNDTRHSIDNTHLVFDITVDHLAASLQVVAADEGNNTFSCTRNICYVDDIDLMGTPHRRESTHSQLWIIILVSTAVVLLIVCLTVVVYFRVPRRRPKQTWSDLGVVSGDMSIVVSDTVLGSGGQAVVYKGMCTRTGVLVAVKKADNRSEDGERAGNAERLANEYAILSEIEHPNVVRVHGYLKATHCAILEYMAGGTLWDALSQPERLSLSTVSVYSNQILQGLQCLHRNNIVHHDLKPSNILIDEYGTCKIGDFGCSRRLENVSITAAACSDKRSSTVVGTVVYYPPEVTQGTSQSCAGDIWSFGLTVLYMLTGLPPWYIYNDNLIQAVFALSKLADTVNTSTYSAYPFLLVHDDGKQPIMAEQGEFSSGQQTPELQMMEYPVRNMEHGECITNFLGLCLQVDPKKRGSCNTLLRHPFCGLHKQVVEQPVAPVPPVSGVVFPEENISDIFSEG